MDTAKVRIAFDATTLVNSLVKDIARTGVYFATYNIFCNMLKRDDVEVVLYSPRVAHMRQYLDMHAQDFGRVAMTGDLSTLGDIDAFFSAGDPIHEGVRRYCPRLSCYSVIHDIIPIVHPEYFRNLQFPAMWDMLDHFDKTDHYFAVSESTKRDVVRMSANADPERISVIHLGANEHFHQNRDAATFEAVRRKYKIPENKKYILSLCTKEPRKNLVNAVKAFIEFIQQRRIEDLVYVLAGGTWSTFKEELEKCLSNLGQYEDKIVSIGYVDDKDVASLYSNAQWFVYTSHYEGFGLPPLEAMQCGCPVVASNNSSLPEVVGDSALTVDSHDVGQHVEAYGRYYFDPALRDEYSRKGLERAKLFSWKKCADIICDKIIADAEKKRAAPRASIVLAVNCPADSEDFPAVCARIESVRTQTYENKDVLVMDCGARPEISEQLKKHALDNAVPLKSVPGLDACQAFNVALDGLDGKYAAFLSPRMYYADPDYVSVCVAKNEEFDADISYADCRLSDSRLKEIWSADRGRIPFGEHFCTGSVMIRLAVLRQANGFAAGYGAAAFDELIMRLARDKARFNRIWSVAVGLKAAERRCADVDAYAKAYYDVFGKEAGLSPTEARELCSGDYLKSYTDAKFFAVAKKLPSDLGGNALCENLYQHRRGDEIADGVRRAELSKCRHLLFGFIPLGVSYAGTPFRNEVVYSLPGGIPVVKIKRRAQARTSYYLFNILPLFRTKS